MIVNTPFIYDRNCIRIYEEITNNAITIDGIDYFVDSISRLPMRDIKKKRLDVLPKERL